MTKPSQRRPVRYDQSGCMWGLIRILDFHHGSRSTRKLLADKRHGSRLTSDAGDLGGKPKLLTDVEENLLGTLGNEESFEMGAADSPANKPSMKTLIEEEMVSEQPTGNKISDSKLHAEQHVARKNRRRSKNSRGNLDTGVGNLNGSHESFNSSTCPFNHIPDEGLVNKQNPNDVILEEFCNHVNQRGISKVSLKQKPKSTDHDVKEKLHEAIKKFISREVANEKNLIENGRVNFSKEVVDALQIRNLNEESFLKLLQDPNFLSMKNTETLNPCKDNELKDSEELFDSNDNSSKQRKFFRRHMKFQETKLPEKKLKGPDTNTIVILKPRPIELKSYAAEGGPDSLSDSSRSQLAERARAHFFLAEIKRRWKNVMGKEQNPDIVVKRQSFRFRGENPEKKSLSKDHFFIEKVTKPRDFITELENVGRSKQRAPNIYIEAKRHLSEILSSGYQEIDSSLGMKSPKTLARILALSEFNSPIPSPGRNRERSFMTAQTRFSGENNNQFEKISENVEQKMMENNGSCLSSSTHYAEAEPSMITRHVENEKVAWSAAREDMSSDGGNMIKTDEIAWQECSSISVAASSELVSFPIAQCVESIHSSETANKYGETQDQEEEEDHSNQCPSSSFESPPHACLTTIAMASEISGDKLERPSPVSVLEPLFMEEETSPARTTSRTVELLIQPLGIKFEDRDNFNPPEQGNLFKNCMGTEEGDILLLYVRSVLQACGLNWNELYLKSQSSLELLEPSFYGVTDFFCNHPQYDQNLVFDCINEVLLEMIDHHFRFCPLLSFTKPIVRPIPDLKDATGEVWQQVYWHLLPMPLPRTLDQIVHRDMNSEKWMDLRAGTEGIGFEMSDEILDDLIEDCVDENMHSLRASNLAYIEENWANISS